MESVADCLTQKTAQIMSRKTWELKNYLLRLDIIVDKMKLFTYKNPKITAYLRNLRKSIISPLSEMGMLNFLAKFAIRMFAICINI